MGSDEPRHTLAVHLWAGQVRGALPNGATMMRPAQSLRMAGQRRSLRELFVAAYPRFAPAIRPVEEPGLAVVAIDEITGDAAGIAWLIARVARPVTAIIGRHDRCDLFLAARPELALRQLAVVLEPVTSWVRGSTAIRYRICDLRTGDPMVDETGRTLRGLTADGPAIVRCGGYAMYVLPLGEPSDWPPSAEDAWAMLPERTYVDALEGGATGTAGLKLPRTDARATFITRTHGPRDTSMRLAQGSTAGTLELHSPERQLVLTIGDHALRDGVLLGRYERCDATAAVGDDTSLSRVHALLIQAGDRLLMVDTASSNGTFDRGERVRLVQLAHDTEVRLGKKTHARWRWLA